MTWRGASRYARVDCGDWWYEALTIFVALSRFRTMWKAIFGTNMLLGTPVCGKKACKNEDIIEWCRHDTRYLHVRVFVHSMNTSRTREVSIQQHPIHGRSHTSVALQGPSCRMQYHVAHL